MNEIALALFFSLFGGRIAVLYLLLGLAVAIVAGFVIGRLRTESHVEAWVYEVQLPEGESEERIRWVERFDAGWQAVRDIVGRVWPYILLGIGVGAGIHGYVPEEFMASIMGAQAWWSVPLALAIGVPMYSNAAGIIPVVQALLAKGAALGPKP